MRPTGCSERWCRTASGLDPTLQVRRTARRTCSTRCRATSASVREGWPPVVSDVYGRLASYELVGASACVREIVGALAALARAVADRDGDVLAELRVAGR